MSLRRIRRSLPLLILGFMFAACSHHDARIDNDNISNTEGYIPMLTSRQFGYNDIQTLISKHTIPLPKSLYNSISQQEAIVTDSSRIIGVYYLRGLQWGVVCYHQPYNCDHQTEYIALYTFEHLRTVKRYVLAMADDETMIYHISSKLSRGFDTLFTRIEYALVEDPEQDTLFTENIGIALGTESHDTILHQFSHLP